MLSYRHGFHAGGWADVHKHTALMLLLMHLGRKPAPFSVLDAYAGDAVYDLGGAEALKTREFETGIGRLYDADGAPPGVGEYLDAVRACNPGRGLSLYPGSPAVVRSRLRDGDRLILNELHPAASRALAAWGRADPRIAVHRRDAMEFLRALVTPRLRRGLVLIDPAYEVKSEYDTLAAAVERAVTRWPQGIFAVWYPILAEGRHRALLAALAGIDGLDALVSEIRPPATAGAPGAPGMHGAGVVVINPPWRLDEQLQAAGAWLAAALWRPRSGTHGLKSLRPPG